MKQVLRLFRELVQNGSIDDRTDLELFTAFRDTEVRAQLDEFAEQLGFVLVTAPHRVYLVPELENSLLGFSQRELRESAGSNASTLDLYLQSYILMVILWMFYGSKNSDPQRTSFLQIKDVVDMLDQRLPMGERIQSEDWKQQADIDFQQLCTHWNSMHIQQERRTSTRLGVVLKACRLLERQKLAQLYDEQRELRPTQRLNDLMKHYYLNDTRIHEIHQLFDGEVGKHAEAQPNPDR